MIEGPLRHIEEGPFREGGSLETGEFLGEQLHPIVPGTSESPVIAGDDFVEIPETVEVEPLDPEQVKADFERLLADISQSTGQPLTMEGRNMQFVTNDELYPKTDEEINSFRELYGESVIEGGSSGENARNPDGTFTIRIGYFGLEDFVDRDVAIELLAHEYGHTLGRQLDSIIDEELKAYTFEALARRLNKYKDWEGEVFSEIDSYSPVHMEASSRLAYLTQRGVTEEAILAHLTGENFGTTTPDDYFKQLVQGCTVES